MSIRSRLDLRKIKEKSELAGGGPSINMCGNGPQAGVPVQAAQENSRVRWRASCFTALFLVSLAASAKTILILARTVVNSSEYTHAALVLPVSVALVYRKGKPTISSRFLLGIVLMALIMTLAFILRRDGGFFTGDEQVFASVFLLVSFWISAFYTCFGPAATREAAFPLLFLFLLVPLPQDLMSRIISWLQQGSADMAGALFALAGVPVVRSNLVFTLANQQIEVARECSGIRSSIFLLITTLVFAHLFLQSNWRRFLLVVAVIPMSLLKNGLRIFVLSVLANYVDPGILAGPVHHKGGVIFFGVAAGCLAFLLWILVRLERRSRLRKQARLSMGRGAVIQGGEHKAMLSGSM